MDKNIDHCLSENPPQMSLLQGNYNYNKVTITITVTIPFQFGNTETSLVVKSLRKSKVFKGFGSVYYVQKRNSESAWTKT